MQYLRIVQSPVKYRLRSMNYSHWQYHSSRCTLCILLMLGGQSRGELQIDLPMQSRGHVLLPIQPWCAQQQEVEQAVPCFEIIERDNLSSFRLPSGSCHVEGCIPAGHKGW